MESREFSGKSVDEAITKATIELGVTSDRIDYDVIEKGSSGFLGIGSKDAVIRVTLKSDKKEEEDGSEIGEIAKSADVTATAIDNSTATENASHIATAIENATVSGTTEVKNDKKPADEAEVKEKMLAFLEPLFKAMELEVNIDMRFDADNNNLYVDLSGPKMGIIIGKRGQTLDSLQYLSNLALNKRLDTYVRVKLDTEDYRRRRKATLENLAKNVAYKVKRTRRSISLEPMNPYERRIIHYALQHDGYVTTYSEGDEPYRHVVVALK